MMFVDVYYLVDIQLINVVVYGCLFDFCKYLEVDIGCFIDFVVNVYSECVLENNGDCLMLCFGFFCICKEDLLCLMFFC